MHYKNGRVPVIGDPVVGETHNSLGVVAGTLLSLSSAQSSCDATVGFLETAFLYANISRGAGFVPTGFVAAHVHGTRQHGMEGPPAVTVFRRDYADCARLLHAEDMRAPSYILDVDGRQHAFPSQMATGAQIKAFVPDFDPSYRICRPRRVDGPFLATALVPIEDLEIVQIVGVKFRSIPPMHF